MTLRRDLDKSASFTPPEHNVHELSEKAELDGNALLPHTSESNKTTGGQYYIGDVYEPQPTAVSREWEIDTSDMPYLRHIKNIAPAWPHLRYLASWMEVTTSPLKWGLIQNNEGVIRAERASRTKVAVVDFTTGRNPAVAAEKEVTDIKSLRQALSEKPYESSADAHRLYVVEDLSRDVIEALGSCLDIDPMFFREQINDYWWHNTRDPWVELPDLEVVNGNQPFFRLTFVQPRYFKNEASFKIARIQAGMFNVLRRLDDDSEHKALFDENNAIIALVRSKASWWVRPRVSGQGHVGVLLVDPSITEGYPLWGGHRPFIPSPRPSDQTHYDIPPHTTLFRKFLFWTLRMNDIEISAIKDDPRIMGYRMAQIICAEWLTLCHYVMTRLAQTEWELERPELRKSPTDINSSLGKLHTWRRRIPLYRSMVTYMRRKLAPASGQAEGHAASQYWDMLRADLDDIGGRVDDLNARTERIAMLATAVTSIEESRRAIDQNHALTRLTYLAVVFAPLSFVSSFFSMAPDVTALTTTYWVYFAVAVPLSLIAFLVVNPSNWHKLAVPFVKLFPEKATRKKPVGI